MALITTDDLAIDALWRAGESTTGTSDYNLRVLDYMQHIYDLLLFGGGIGTRDIAISAGAYVPLIEVPMSDWPWLLKQPRGVFNTQLALKSIGTATVTNGSTNLVFSSAPAVSVTGWRFKALQASSGMPAVPQTVPRISAHTAGQPTATLDIEWPEETQTLGQWAAFPLEYPLATDFIRFTAAPTLHAWGSGWQPRVLDISIGQESMENQYPLTQIEEGAPSAAALIDNLTIQMNRYDPSKQYRVEYAYIFRPPAIQAGVGQEPVMPREFRTLLSLGAAMLVLQDKADGKTDRVASEFRETFYRMTQAYRVALKEGSQVFGRFLYRNPNRTSRTGRIVRSNSGQIIF